jgi:uncharacterized pyridoxamine 5'-phosphate oxidase family protein
MTYQQWLENIKLLEGRGINIQVLELLEQQEPNSVIEEMLTPKLEELITKRTNYSITEIIHNLEIIFSDINELDYNLVKFKKEIGFIIRLIKLKQIPYAIQSQIFKKFKTDIDEVYKILKQEADMVDYTGSFSQIIKNNEYKWSE